MTPLSALPIAAAALSLPLAWRTPAHRPLAFTLVAAQALEALRPHLPPEAAWGALLALPALSTWAVRRTLLGHGDATSPLWALGAWALAWGLLLAAPWSCWWTVALWAAVAAQGAAWWRWRAARRKSEKIRAFIQDAVDRARARGNTAVRDEAPVAPPSISEQAALVLAAGDAGGLLVGLAAGWSAVGWWAAAVAAVLVGVQARALLAGRAGR